MEVKFENEQAFVAAMLTIAWASTKQRDVSQDEINAIYKNFGGKKQLKSKNDLEIPLLVIKK